MPYPREGYVHDPKWVCQLTGVATPVFHAPSAGQNMTDEAKRAADNEVDRRGAGRFEAVFCGPCSTELSKKLLSGGKRTGIVAYHVEATFG